MNEHEGAVPADTRVGRVSLLVNDQHRVANFYTDVVGLRVFERADERTVLGAGDDALLELNEEPDAPERGRDEAGLFHVAFRVPSRAALADVFTRIREQWRLTGASNHRVSDALYCTDPEGNGVEVYWDHPRDEWPTTGEGRVRMDTLPLDLDALADLGTGASALPDGSDVGHVHLEVSSLDATRAFYVDALGLRVRQDWNGDALFLAAGDYHHHVGANTWNGRSAPRSGRGLRWFELAFPDTESLAAATDRLHAAGWGVTRRPEAAVVADPDGIEVRLRTD